MEVEIPYDDWLKAIPAKLQSDPLWKAIYYRKLMYLYDLVWLDCDVLRKDYRGREIVNQIVRSAGSICANVEEAYGRGVGTADYVRVMRIALGEARETQGWYFRSRHILPPELLERRIALLQQTIIMLVETIDTHRRNLRS
jgi:four helix bundle protein